MSLINDALKRAGESPPPPPPVPNDALQAAEEPPGSRLPLYLIPILLLSVIGLAVWFLAKGLEVARQVYNSSGPTRIQAREPAPPEADRSETTGLVQSAGGPGSFTAEAIPAAEAAAPSNPSPIQPPAPAVPVAPAFPELKLQALFYRPSQPTAVINTKTVGIGSQINGATVLSITRDGVQVLWQGQSRELTLP